MNRIKDIQWIYRVFDGYLNGKDTSIGVDNAMQRLKEICTKPETESSSAPACSIAWSTKAPDTEGFYWLDAMGNGIRPQVVPVVFNKDAIRDGVSGYRFGFHLPGVAVEMVSSGARWAGPLNPPEQ